MSENSDPLDLLLAAFDEVEQTDTTKTLKETNLFEQETNIPNKQFNSGLSNGLIHSGDTDSSDDEGNRHWQERKYSENGTDIKRLLDTSSSIGTDSKRVSRVSTWKSAPKSITNQNKPDLSKQPDSGVKTDVYTDPIFGLRIINPLISSTVLKERMIGRQAVNFMGLNRFLQIKTQDKDWVIAGVIISKTVQKTSQKGMKYSLWTLSDLKDDIKTVGLFLFGGANEGLWKTTVGTVVGVLNPDVLEKRNNDNKATLSINNVQKVMIFGQSKDFGTCKSVKKNGDKCTVVVNVNRCEFCIYHIKQEYQKCSVRSDLQSTFGGRGLTALRNKVLGKNEVFYAGKSYAAVPTKRSKKDDNRLNSLSGKATIGPKLLTNKIPKKSAARLDVPHGQRVKDLQLLAKLNGDADLTKKTLFEGKQSSEITLEAAKSLATSVLTKLKAKQQNPTTEPSGSSSGGSTKSEAPCKTASSTSSILKSPGSSSSSFKPHATASDCLNLPGTSKDSSKPVKPSSKTTDSILKSLEPLNSSFKSNGTVSNCLNLPGTSKDSSKPSKTTDNILKSPEPSGGSFKPHATASDCLNLPGTSKGSSKPVKPSSKTTDSILKSLEPLNSSFKSNGTVSNCLNLPGTSKDSSKPSKTTDSISKPPKPSSTSLRPKPTVDSLKYLGPFSGPNYVFPKLSGFDSGLVDLDKPITPTRRDRAKQNAIKLIQKVGPIEKSDPNNFKSCKKRRLGPEADPEAKRFKAEPTSFSSERYKRIMASLSSHPDLIEARDDEEKEKYFNKLEMKENMEEKMIGTHKVACKAVRCLRCKYVSFSASDLCKSERHPLKVFDATKRFYKCGNCQFRTVCLEVVPLKVCNNCGCSKWEKTGMMKEKLVTVSHGLSIRGGEQKHLNSVVTDSSLDLLVPD